MQPTFYNEYFTIDGTLVINSPASSGGITDAGLIPALGRFSGGNSRGNPFQYSCQENPIDRRAWQVVVHKVTKRRTRLK